MNDIDPGAGPSPSVTLPPDGETALLAAEAAAAEAARLARGDPAAARAVYREAWGLLAHALQTGVPAGRTAPLEAEIRQALDDLSATRFPEVRLLRSLEPTADPMDLVTGPGGDVYISDAATGTVRRVDSATGGSTVVARIGDAQGSGMAAPRLLTTAGRDLLILDADGELWGWRSAGRSGARATCRCPRASTS